MGVRLRAAAGTLAVVGIPVLTIWLLHGMAGDPWMTVDWANLSGWLRSTPLEGAVTAMARIVALTLSYHLAISTLAYLGARVSGNRRLVRFAGRFTLPVVRKLADRVVAGSIAVGVLASPLIASAPAQQTPPAPRPPVSEQVAPDYAPAAYRVAGDPEEAQLAAAYSARPAVTPATEHESDAEVPAVGEIEVTVADGDSLWTLAERRLADPSGSGPPHNEVAPYWRTVVDTNRHRLRSGDPDLVYPGERILLPDPGRVMPGGS